MAGTLNQSLTANGGSYPNVRGTLIPEVWSPRIVDHHYETEVLTEISNTHYEG